MGWTKEFFCQSTSTFKYKIVYNKDDDSCYIDYKK